MTKIISLLFILLLASGLVLTACKSTTPTPQSTSTSNKAEAVFTSAAQTAEGMAQATAAAPTVTPLKPTQPPITPTASFTPTQMLTPLATPSQTATKQAGGWNMALFVTDVTIPDGTSLTPGQAFVKTWRLKNVGTTTWTTAYTLVYAYGEQMGGPASSPLPSNTPPGQTLDLSISLVAPSKAGHYRGYWQLKDPNGQVFGVGAAYNEPIWVDIFVIVTGASAATPTATATVASPPAATITPTATSTKVP